MNRQLQTIVITVSAVFGLVSLACQSPGSAQQIVAYTDANVETAGPLGRIQGATLIVRDGKIEEVGRNVNIGPEAKRVSMQGKTIMPGIIDPYFVFNKKPRAVPVTTPGRRRFRRATTQRFEAGSFLNVAQYFYPYTTDFKPAIRSGITTVNLVTDGRGFSALANLQVKPDDGMLIPESGFLFAKVTNQTSALDVLRNGLDPQSASQSRRGGRSRFSQRGSRGGGESGNNESKTADDENKQSQDNDETKALWQAVRDGQRPLVVNINNAATVSHVLKLMHKFDKVKLYLVASGPNLYQSLDEIKSQKNVTLVLQPGIDTEPFSSRRINVPHMISQRDIPFAFSMSLNESQMKDSQDDPLFPIAILVKNGLPRHTSLKALTISPAKMLGIDETHGSLEAGKMANFLVFDGDPLETGSRLQQVIVKGRLVHEN